MIVVLRHNLITRPIDQNLKEFVFLKLNGIVSRCVVHRPGSAQCGIRKIHCLERPEVHSKVGQSMISLVTMPGQLL